MQTFKGSPGTFVVVAERDTQLFGVNIKNCRNTSLNVRFAVVSTNNVLGSYKVFKPRGKSNYSLGKQNVVALKLNWLFIPCFKGELSKKEFYDACTQNSIINKFTVWLYPLLEEEGFEVVTINKVIEALYKQLVPEGIECIFEVPNISGKKEIEEVEELAEEDEEDEEDDE